MAKQLAVGSKQLGKGGKAGLQTRDLAIVAMLVAVGAVLRVASPPMGTITPNWMISLYVLAILLVKPTWKQAIGIGIVAGAVCVPTSKAPVPWATLLSEPVGAFVAALLVSFFANITDKKFPVKALVIAGLATLASGTTFVLVTKAVIPQKAVLAVMLTTVYTVTTVNAVFTQILYYPAKRLLNMRGDK